MSVVLRWVAERGVQGKEGGREKKRKGWKMRMMVEGEADGRDDWKEYVERMWERRGE